MVLLILLKGLERTLYKLLITVRLSKLHTHTHTHTHPPTYSLTHTLTHTHTHTLTHSHSHRESSSTVTDESVSGTTTRMLTYPRDNLTIDSFISTLNGSQEPV